MTLSLGLFLRGRSLPPPEKQKKAPIAKTQSGKCILQQQATRGCTAACVEMLKADNGKEIDWSKMRFTNLGGTDTMKYGLEDSGLNPLVQNIAFEKINDALCSNGSAIISVETGCGGHVVIVDKIDYKEKTAYIREPYHGWAIIVTLDAFRKAVGHGKPELIQVKK